MKMNGTHVHAVYEKMMTPSCSMLCIILFQVCCRRINIFLINFNFTYTK